MTRILAWPVESISKVSVLNFSLSDEFFFSLKFGDEGGKQ